MKIITITLLCSLFSVTASFCQGQFLLKEINTSWFPPVQYGSSPEGLIEFNGQIYFSAQSDASGRKLWQSDGTRAGTQEYSVNEFDPTDLIVLNNYLYFSAEDSGGDRELYRTDGISNPVKIELNTSASTSPKNMALDQGRVYFKGITPSNGIQVCSFDETNPAVIDIHLAASGGTDYDSYVIVGGELIMIEKVSFSVFRLHTLSTGSSTATPINHGALPDFMHETISPVAYNGKAYFATINDLISADGTGFTIEQTDTSPQSIVVANNQLFFLASASGTSTPSYLHRIDNSGTITDFPFIPLVRVSYNSSETVKSLFVFGNLMYGWIADNASNGIYKFHFSNPAIPSYSANLPSKPFNFESSIAIDDVWYHNSVQNYGGVSGRSILKTDYLGTTILCSNNLDYIQKSLILFKNDLYFTDVFWDNGVPNPQYDCDPPQANTGVEIFKLTQSQLNCQPVTNYYNLDLIDGFYTSGTTLNVGSNMTLSGERCVILKSPSTTVHPTTTVTLPAQLIVLPGGCP